MCVFPLGESKIHICDVIKYELFTTKKVEDMKTEYSPGQFHILVLIMIRKIKQKKQQQTDPHCNNKKKK